MNYPATTWQNILYKMDFYSFTNGFVALSNSGPTFYPQKPSFGGEPITRDEVLEKIKIASN